MQHTTDTGVLVKRRSILCMKISNTWTGSVTVKSGISPGRTSLVFPQPPEIGLNGEHGRSNHITVCSKGRNDPDKEENGGEWRRITYFSNSTIVQSSAILRIFGNAKGAMIVFTHSSRSGPNTRWWRMRFGSTSMTRGRPFINCALVGLSFSTRCPRNLRHKITDIVKCQQNSTAVNLHCQPFRVVHGEGEGLLLKGHHCQGLKAGCTSNGLRSRPDRRVRIEHELGLRMKDDP